MFFALSVSCFRFAGRVFQIIDRPSVGPKPSGSSPLYYVDVKVCYLGGGSLDGGDLASPRCLGPPGSTPEGRGAAHGPRHPAYPLLLRPVISFWGFRFHSSWFLGSVWVFALKQRFLYAFVLPFKTRRVLALWLVSLSLSLSFSFSCCLLFLLQCVVAFLFLSSSGAGETQTALRFVVPLVFLPGHALCHRPVPPAPHFLLGHRPAPVFSILFLVVWFCCRRLSLSLSLFLSLWFRSPRLCVQIFENTLGWPTRRRPQL